jgi:succinyl-diaminopimelate desuccinylase
MAQHTHDTLTLTQALIACASITPNDAGCQQIIGNRLEKLGFFLQPMPFQEVENLWARAAL